MPPTIALEQGIFGKYGINAKIVLFRGAPTLVASLKKRLRRIRHILECPNRPNPVKAIAGKSVICDVLPSSVRVIIANHRDTPANIDNGIFST